MNPDHLKKLTQTFMTRHWMNIEANYRKLSSVSIEARNALIGSLASEVMANPPSCFHSATGGEYANMGKANTNQHKEVKALLAESIHREVLDE